MTDRPSPAAPSAAAMTGLLQEAGALWRDYLLRVAADPAAKTELMKQVAAWQALAATAAMQGAAAPAGFAGSDGFGQAGGDDIPATSTSAPASAAPRPAPAGAASDDGALRLAQLALRVGELEQRVAALESGQP